MNEFKFALYAKNFWGIKAAKLLKFIPILKKKVGIICSFEERSLTLLLCSKIKKNLKKGFNTADKVDVHASKVYREQLRKF